MGRATRTAVQAASCWFAIAAALSRIKWPRWHPKRETGLIPCRDYTERAAVRLRNLVGDIQTQA
jgi:hypothetical protein